MRRDGFISDKDISFDEAVDKYVPKALRGRVTDPKKAREKISRLKVLEDGYLNTDEHPQALAALAQAEFDAGINQEAAENFKAAAQEGLKYDRYKYSGDVGRWNKLANKLIGSNPRKGWEYELGRRKFEAYIPTTAIIALILGVLFLSFNMTGNVIGSQASSNWVGAIFIILGITGIFFWFRSRKR